MLVKKEVKVITAVFISAAAGYKSGAEYFTQSERK
jgi:hypothetical protein